MLDIRVHLEPASLILDLCTVPMQQQLGIIGRIIEHTASRSVWASEGIGLSEAEDALRRYSCGLPTEAPGLHLDEIRKDAPALKEYVNKLLEDHTWLQNASDLALRYIPWKDELRRTVDVHLVAFGGPYIDGGSWLKGSKIVVALDVWHLKDPDSLQTVAAHELNCAAIFAHFCRMERRGIRWYRDLSRDVAIQILLLYMEGLSRFASLRGTYRDDLESCFRTMQAALDCAAAGLPIPRSADLWQGGDGGGHIGGTVGVHIFRVLASTLDRDAFDKALREGPLAVLRLYETVSCLAGSPSLRVPSIYQHAPAGSNS